MKRWVWLIAMAGCATELSTSEVEQHAGDYQAGDYQSGDYQAGDYQAGDYQAGDYQGAHYDSTDYANGTLNGAALSSVSVTGTTLVAWRSRGKLGWEQRFPDHICNWDVLKTTSSCGPTIDTRTSPSPLAGMRFRTTLRTPTGTMTGWVQIGASSSALSAVVRDPSTAMWSLYPFGTGAYDSTGTCSNPGGCRKNSDLWVYDLKLVNGDGTMIPFCSSNMSYALKGTWDAVGKFTTSSTKFTFACSTGTIAKCTRWGYRNWVTNAKPPGSSPLTPGTSLAPYHQACVRAAMADYCANGHTFTKSHTFVDIFDYAGSGSVGFIKRASEWPWESEFDTEGAVYVDNLRYEELEGNEAYGSINDPDPNIGCPTRFELYTGDDDVIAKWTRMPYGATPLLTVASGPQCAHTVLAVGKWLNSACSACAAAVASSVDPTGQSSWGYCTDPASSKGWDQNCVDKAQTIGCGGSHDECSTGGGLGKWSSACTAAVCSDPNYQSCCNIASSTAWTSACAAKANAVCTGGREHRTFVNDYGFCNVVIPPQNSL